MKYNFDNLTNRFNSNQIKWDVKENELPMWVADMDFCVLPEIKEALYKTIDVGAFGYSFVSDEFYEAFISWWKRRHDIIFKKEWMAFSSSVIATIDVLINTLTNPADNVVVLSPIYNAFFNCIKNFNRNVVESFLIRNADKYEIDFDDLEEKLSNKKSTMFIFCNPHNPVGKIFTKDEIIKVSNLCKKYNVIFVSDEIHCDIVEPNKQYVPVLSVTSDTIVCVSASKVFNLAGLQSSCVVIPNLEIKEKVQKALWKYDVGEPNCFVCNAAAAAFNYGDLWVDELNQYLSNNKQVVSSFIKNNLPHLCLINCEATYLLWIDISYYSSNCAEFCKQLRQHTGLYVSSGDIYGSTANQYIRMNIATSLKNVNDGLSRLKLYINKLEKEKGEH